MTTEVGAIVGDILRPLAERPDPRCEALRTWHIYDGAGECHRCRLHVSAVALLSDHMTPRGWCEDDSLDAIVACAAAWGLNALHLTSYQGGKEWVAYFEFGDDPEGTGPTPAHAAARALAAAVAALEGAA